MKKLTIIPILILLLFVNVTSSGFRAYGDSCEDTDEGWNYEIFGETVLSGNRGERTVTDYCRNDDRLVEHSCGRRYGGWIAFNRVVSCSGEFGEGYSCFEGACVSGENINEEYSVDENTIALWHFNEGEENRAYDETENNNDGTVSGASWTEDGKFGNALNFDGENDLISVPYQRVLIPEHLTLEAWIKKSSNARGSVISKNGPYYLGFINEGNNNDDNEANQLVGKVYINNVGWVEVVGETELELNVWYHIAMTYDGESIKLYVNGVEDGSTETNGDILITGQALHVGWGEPGVNFYFEGLIDEVRISSVARDYYYE